MSYDEGVGWKAFIRVVVISLISDYCVAVVLCVRDRD